MVAGAWLSGNDVRVFISFLRHYPLVVAVLAVGVVAGAFQLSGSGASAIILTVAAIVYAAWTLVGMVRDMLHGHFGLDVLALLAIVATVAVGEYWASLIVMLMLSGGEALEDYAAGRAKRELTALLDATPEVAHLPDGDVPAEDVQVGDLLLVLPGEVVPVDAELLSESATFDEASITGESLPVTAVAGTEVPSGAVNGAQAVQMRALRPASGSQFQQIVNLVRDAESSQAPVVRVADRFAIPFTAVSLLIAGVAWAISGDPVRFAEVLVLATPCPLLIAAPVAFMGGMSRAARNGVIVKGGVVLEVGSRIKSAAFDKTGTLTAGQPEVVDLQVHAGTPENLLRMAATVEQYSTHVLARGVCRSAADLHLGAASDAREVAGQGVMATVDDQPVKAGRLGFVPGAVPADLQPGQGAVYVSAGDVYLGAVILADRVRPEAAEVVKSLGVDSTLMVTGDEAATANLVASQVGITNVQAGLRPAQKVQAVKELQPKPTMMVGDGVNDAPVLAAADLGVALGAKGSAAAGQAADAVVLQDSLVPVLSLLEISRHTMSVALTAIWIGVLASVGLMLVATTGVIPAVAGAFTQELLDLVCILYALRALGGRRPKAPATNG